MNQSGHKATSPVYVLKDIYIHGFDVKEMEERRES
jgi:hypothetical protein